METIEVKHNEKIICPFCNKLILANDGESPVEECPHTLIIATDEGIEFCSEKLNQEDLEEQAEEDSWDEVIGKIEYPGAKQIKCYAPAPSFFGAYFVFAQ